MRSQSRMRHRDSTDGGLEDGHRPASRLKVQSQCRQQDCASGSRQVGSKVEFVTTFPVMTGSE